MPTFRVPLKGKEITLLYGSIRVKAKDAVEAAEKAQEILDDDFDSSDFDTEIDDVEIAIDTDEEITQVTGRADA